MAKNVTEVRSISGSVYAVHDGSYDEAVAAGKVEHFVVKEHAEKAAQGGTPPAPPPPLASSTVKQNEVAKPVVKPQTV